MGCGCFLRTFFNTSFLPSLSSCPSTITVVTRTRRIVTRTVLVQDSVGGWLGASRQRAPMMMTGARKPWQPAVQPPSHQVEGSISEGGEGGRQGGLSILCPNLDFRILDLSSGSDRGGPNAGMVVTPPGDQGCSLVLVDNGLDHSWSLCSGQGQSAVGVADTPGLIHLTSRQGLASFIHLHL